jgi:hypothetical protein
MVGIRYAGGVFDLSISFRIDFTLSSGVLPCGGKWGLVTSIPNHYYLLDQAFQLCI